MHLSIRRAIAAYRHRHVASLRNRRRRALPVTTRQWLVLTLGITTLVGVIFILAAYFQLGR